jgi:toxin secretion/phage lysis holin
MIEKLGLSSLIAMFAIHLGGAGMLVWLLIIFTLTDYFTGLTAAIKNKGLDSHTAFWGAVKKVCGFVVVGVALGVDILVSLGTREIGLQVPNTAFGILALCYLISTEAISILENLAEIGVNVPFLGKAIKVIRGKIGQDEESGKK